MLYRQYSETKMVATGVTLSANKQMFSFKINQQKRRLEGVILEPIFLTPAGAPTVTSDGFANIFSEVRVKVNDVLGARNAVQCPSAVLLNWNEGQGGKPNRHNMFGERPVTPAKNYRLQIPVWLRHPAIEEPVGNLLGVPLDQLNEDVTVEIDVASNGDSASANPSVSMPALRATILYRDVDPAAKYLPTELITVKNTLLSTGKQSIDIANGGFLSSLMVDQYSTFPTARTLGFTANDHELQIDLGSVGIVRKFPTIMDFLLDNVIGHVPSTTPAFGRVAAVDTSGTDVTYSGRFLGNYLFDFLYDDTHGGAISPASLLNCNSVPLGGDRVKLTGTNYSAAITQLLTHHKFLTRAASDLAVLIGG